MYINSVDKICMAVNIVNRPEEQANHVFKLNEKNNLIGLHMSKVCPFFSLTSKPLSSSS